MIRLLRFLLLNGVGFVLGLAVGRRALGGSIRIDDLAHRAAVGRKLAIYEKETELFAYWYAKLRGQEECYRAERYGRPLCLVLVEPAAGSDAWPTSRKLAEWLGSNGRKSDIPAYLGNARYLVLMPETPLDKAEKFATRLRRVVPEADSALAALPEDGLNFAALLAKAEAGLSHRTQAAA